MVHRMLLLVVAVGYVAAFFLFALHTDRNRMQDRISFGSLEPPVPFTYSRLFLVSLLGLYFEMLMIRWLSSEIRIFAYYKNFVLIACFLGFGLGAAFVPPPNSHNRDGAANDLLYYFGCGAHSRYARCRGQVDHIGRNDIADANLGHIYSRSHCVRSVSDRYRFGRSLVRMYRVHLYSFGTDGWLDVGDRSPWIARIYNERNRWAGWDRALHPHLLS